MLTPTRLLLILCALRPVAPSDVAAIASALGKLVPSNETRIEAAAAMTLWEGERGRVDGWARGDNGTVLFVHVHKGGGSTICAMAQGSDVRIPPPETSRGWMGKNCNPRKVDKWRAWQAPPDVMVQYARRLGVQFYAIEV